MRRRVLLGGAAPHLAPQRRAAHVTAHAHPSHAPSLARPATAQYDKGTVRRISARTGIVTTVVGTGTQGNGAPGGPALLTPLFQPTNLWIDSAGSMFIVEVGWAGANGYDRLRRVDRDGIVHTVAGGTRQSYRGYDKSPALVTIDWSASCAVCISIDMIPHFVIVFFNTVFFAMA